MSEHCSTTQVRRGERHLQLKAIVARLGVAAGPEQIRAEVARLGMKPFGTAAISKMRSELWPDRPKHNTGLEKKSSRGQLLFPGLFVDGLLTCPQCHSRRVRVRTTRQLSDGTVERGRECRECQHRFVLIESREEGKIRPERLMALQATEKECTKCKRILPVAAFGKKAGDPHLYRSWCKECMAFIRRTNYGTRSIMQLYGLTLEQYEALFAQQGGVCAICGRPELGMRRGRRLSLAVDHCHDTDTMRGLLCNRCNLGIGNFDDSPERLEAAAAYLRRHAERR